MTGPEQQLPLPQTETPEVDLLLRLARRWRRLGAGATSEQGLSPHQERGLLALARLARRTEQDPSAGARVSHLADHLGIAPRSATEVADALESAGLVKRSPDPTDRRAVLLSLTDTGRHSVAQVRDRRRSAAEEAIGALDPKDRTELRRILGQLLAD
jgi:DNA-binding MarR family transcriptional regulator